MKKSKDEAWDECTEVWDEYDVINKNEISDLSKIKKQKRKKKNKKINKKFFKKENTNLLLGILFIILALLILIPLTSAIVLSPDAIFKGYRILGIDGNESIFFGGNVTLIGNGNVLKIIPSFSDNLTRQEC